MSFNRKSIINPGLNAPSVTSIKSLVTGSTRVGGLISIFDSPFLRQKNVEFSVGSVYNSLVGYGLISGNAVENPEVIDVEQLAAFVDPSASSEQGFGYCCALSGDGNTLAVSGCGIIQSDNTQAWVPEDPDSPFTDYTLYLYTRSEENWSFQGSFVLVGFYNSLSFSDDGNTLAVGSYKYDSYVGYENYDVIIYGRSSGVWSQTATIVSNVYYSQGKTVSLSSDGATLIIGGAVGEFEYSYYNGSSWPAPTTVSIGSFYDTSNPPSVVLSGDGSTVAYGSYEDFGSRGTIAIYTKNLLGGWDEETQLNSPDGEFGAREGFSMDLSDDGNILIAGAPYFGASDVGKVFHYERTGVNWSYIGELPFTGSGLTLFGYSVKMSGDGNVVAVGGPRDSSDIGAIWLYYRDGAGYALEQKIVGSGNINLLYRGISVDVSTDGSTMVFGATGPPLPAIEPKRGAIWVYASPSGEEPSIPLPVTNKLILSDRIFNSFTCENLFTDNLMVKDTVSFFGASPVGQQTATPTINSIVNVLQTYGLSSSSDVWNIDQVPVVGTNVEPDSLPLQGTSVSISFNGQTAVVGGPGGASTDDFRVQGGVWVFIRVRGVWSQQTGPLVYEDPPPSSLEYAEQGYSVSTTSKGNIIAVGAPNTDNPAVGGATFIYERLGTNWVLQQGPLQGLFPGDTTNREGQVVSLSSLGKRLLVTGNTGTISGLGPGGFFIWDYDGADWNKTVGPLNPDPPIPTTNFGFSGQLSGDGNTAVLGDPEYNSTGAIWIYERNEDAWDIITGPLTASPSLGDDSNLGYSVAISDDGRTVATGSTVDYNDRGATYIYYKGDDGVWGIQAGPIVGSSPTTNSKQGFSVSLSSDGNTLVVGGNSNNGGEGAVWTFVRTGTEWTQRGIHLVVDSEDSIEFGTSVAISANGKNLTVGSPKFEGTGGVYNSVLVE